MDLIKTNRIDFQSRIFDAMTRLCEASSREEILDAGMRLFSLEQQMARRGELKLVVDERDGAKPE